MKDWNIQTNDHRYTFLGHWHGNLNYRSFRDADGNWYCRFCKEYAPEEICFCAELAGCVADSLRVLE